MQEEIVQQMADKLYEIGKQFGFDRLEIRSPGWWGTDIYVINRHALQIEIDWRKNAVFMYAVYLKNGELPDKHTIYNYPDGQWCRKFLTEIYKTKITYPKKYVKDFKNRCSREFLFYCFDFYVQLIQNDPATLKAFFESLDFYS